MRERGREREKERKRMPEAGIYVFESVHRFVLCKIVEILKERVAITFVTQKRALEMSNVNHKTSDGQIKQDVFREMRDNEMQYESRRKIVERKACQSSLDLR